MNTGARHLILTIILFAAVASLSGCVDPRDKIGHTWYIDGVGNWGFGVAEMEQGLTAAGYRGHVSNFRWSVTLNPVLDQTFRIFAKSGGERLGGIVNEQLDRYPNAPVNLIGLSAGSGVAIWAAEAVKPPHKLRNVVLLASSLSSTYDARKALANISGHIIVFHCPSDPVLDGPARVLGSIDGKFDDCAGLVGLRGPGVETGRIKNIPWNSRFAALGWTGSHTDCTSEPFVRVEVSQYIVQSARPPSSVTRASPGRDRWADLELRAVDLTFARNK